jgi:hypothetical protein
MPYRNPNQSRIQAQSQTIFQYAGNTATWRAYISASAGVSVAGFGSTPYYAERTITALFAPIPRAPESQQPAGMIVSNEFQVTTTQKLQRQDELRWRGERYRVDSDPTQATLPGTYIFIVKRGQNT